jgi:hypothetical protein
MAMVLRMPEFDFHKPRPSKSATLKFNKQEDIMAKGNNARKKETKKPKKDKK